MVLIQNPLLIVNHGYIWYTTGSGKTLTSFKAAILATEIPTIDKAIFVVDRKDLDKAINSSIELRSKKDLIERFIEQVNTSTEVDEEWKAFIGKNKEKDMESLIEEENLKGEEARRFLDNAFRDGLIKTTGTDIDRIMPPVSRFASNSRTIKKQTIIDKLLAFFEKYFGPS